MPNYYEMIRSFDPDLHLRYRLALSAAQIGIRATAQAFHCARNTVRKWQRRFQAHGKPGLKEQSRAPATIPDKASPSPQLEQKVLQARDRIPCFGPKRLKDEFNLDCSTGAIGRILKQNGRRSSRKKPRKPARNLTAEKMQCRLSAACRSMSRISAIYLPTARSSTSVGPAISSPPARCRKALCGWHFRTSTIPLTGSCSPIACWPTSSAAASTCGNSSCRSTMAPSSEVTGTAATLYRRSPGWWNRNGTAASAALTRLTALLSTAMWKRFTESWSLNFMTWSASAEPSLTFSTRLGLISCTSTWSAKLRQEQPNSRAIACGPRAQHPLPSLLPTARPVIITSGSPAGSPCTWICLADLRILSDSSRTIQKDEGRQDFLERLGETGTSSRTKSLHQIGPCSAVCVW